MSDDSIRKAGQLKGDGTSIYYRWRFNIKRDKIEIGPRACEGWWHC